ncbi:SMP-30/gluconolactonase/LRE family protein [Deinococcus oregonensis]|uniref:SMP-30/gluconolactonase/LRE family protein n=1 Tax=Deinococcus oregonensis TaxID=1805970 RepID=A0ABV6AWR0_9DEIO
MIPNKKLAIQMLVVSGSLIATAALAQARLPAPVPVANVGLAAPESVLYDAQSDQYLVSNVNGTPLAQDNNGYISRVSPEGKVLDLKWIQSGVGGVTLNSPTGMTVVGNILYVADVHSIRKFDLKTGKPRGNITVPGTSFLNDLTSDAAGTVYASDMGAVYGAQGFEPAGTDAVYKISRSGRVSVLARGTHLKEPNGVLALPSGKIQTVSFASNEIYTLDAAGQIGDVVKLPGGALDGVVSTNDGRLLVSSWETSSIYAVDAQGSASVLAGKLPSPADIGWDSKRERVMTPILSENRLVFQNLK